MEDEKQREAHNAPRSFVKFSELVRLLEHNGLTLIKEKGSIRYYGKPGIERLVRIDYHGSKESADWNLSCYP